MSRPRKPSVLKLVKGTEKPSRVNPDEPKPEIAIPEAPHHLSKPAREEWDRMAPILSDMGLISDLDRAAFAMYCQSWGEYVEAENHIRRNGRVVKTPNGSVQVSPWVSISRNARLIAHKFLSCFGMTPADRGRVSARREDTKKDPAKRFFK